jgi:hypothetical protein
MSILAVQIPYAALTIIFIVLATLVTAFVRRVTRDKCLKDFEGNMITLERGDNKIAWGRLAVENTGLELLYPATHKDSDGHIEKSYILYKYEFPHILLLVRYHHQLSEKNKKKRQIRLKKTYHPGFFRRMNRRIKNLFKTMRDSLMEVINILISQARKVSPAGQAISSQDKYVTQMKTDLVGTVGTSYEPLLEKYIGRKVVLEMVRAEAVVEYCGVLRDYTADFIEIMDVDYKARPQDDAQKADFIVPRKYGLVRHYAE